MEHKGYIYKEGKKLRTGYTTGSCAAGASKAAAYMLRHQQPIDRITIDTPKGITLKLDVMGAVYSKEAATCYIIKDSGDDPDITNGMEVHATVKLSDTLNVQIDGGVGVGRITQKGFQIPVGEAAINPVPRQMIEKEVRSIIKAPQGVLVEIHLPKGEELAKKTFNPKLGIIGGLSVLGTTGIVEPMSEEALKDTIALELKILREKGYTYVVLMPGNIGQQHLKDYYELDDVVMIKISNYLGFALERCMELGYTRVIIGGHIGKLIKPAGGIYNTHNRVSATRMEILTANLVLVQMEYEGLLKVMDCKTTDEAIEIVKEYKKEEVFQLLANKAAANCMSFTFEQLEIGFALFSMKDFLAASENIAHILGEIRDEQD